MADPIDTTGMVSGRQYVVGGRTAEFQYGKLWYVSQGGGRLTTEVGTGVTPEKYGLPQQGPTISMGNLPAPGWSARSYVDPRTNVPVTIYSEKTPEEVIRGGTIGQTGYGAYYYTSGPMKGMAIGGAAAEVVQSAQKQTDQMWGFGPAFARPASPEGTGWTETPLYRAVGGEKAATQAARTQNLFGGGIQTFPAVTDVLKDTLIPFVGGGISQQQPVTTYFTRFDIGTRQDLFAPIDFTDKRTKLTSQFSLGSLTLASLKSKEVVEKERAYSQTPTGVFSYALAGPGDALKGLGSTIGLPMALLMGQTSLEKVGAGIFASGSEALFKTTSFSWTSGEASRIFTSSLTSFAVGKYVIGPVVGEALKPSMETRTTPGQLGVLTGKEPLGPGFEYTGKVYASAESKTFLNLPLGKEIQLGGGVAELTGDYKAYFSAEGYPGYVFPKENVLGGTIGKVTTAGKEISFKGVGGISALTYSITPTITPTGLLPFSWEYGTQAPTPQLIMVSEKGIETILPKGELRAATWGVSQAGGQTTVSLGGMKHFVTMKDILGGEYSVFKTTALSETSGVIGKSAGVVGVLDLTESKARTLPLTGLIEPTAGGGLLYKTLGINTLLIRTDIANVAVDAGILLGKTTTPLSEASAVSTITTAIGFGAVGLSKLSPVVTTAPAETKQLSFSMPSGILEQPVSRQGTATQLIEILKSIPKETPIRFMRGGETSKQIFDTSTITGQFSKLIPAATTATIERQLGISKVLPLEVTLTSDLSKVFQGTLPGQAQIERTTSKVTPKETPTITPTDIFPPPEFPIFGGGGTANEVLRVPKSKVLGGMGRFGRGGPLAWADIYSVQKTQMLFGGRAKHPRMTGATLKRWTKAASMGFGRGFPTQELENLPRVKAKRISVLGKRKRKKRLI
ncbi:MAG: hypothetical protein Sv326_1316 (plasmid) [Candidatus Fermentimicrarchaeum limneticum]|uniref:Uncharacterized protein n=1 Tax=Fermentimicrarchaeum limneticum TaxID=2795018 RepID=A0A7D5XDN6_FERL1|nr:MAG: hypothetical protein Sv326_1316 [Candidatus Fermentimicrarchaeum limneticum]